MGDYGTLISWLNQEEKIVTFKEFAHCAGMGCKSYQEADELLKKFVTSKAVDDLNTVHVVESEDGCGIRLNQNDEPTTAKSSIFALYKGPAKELKEIARLCAMLLDQTR